MQGIPSQLAYKTQFVPYTHLLPQTRRILSASEIEKEKARFPGMDVRVDVIAMEREKAKEAVSSFASSRAAPPSAFLAKPLRYPAFIRVSPLDNPSMPDLIGELLRSLPQVKNLLAQMARTAGLRMFDMMAYMESVGQNLDLKG